MEVGTIIIIFLLLFIFTRSYYNNKKINKKYLPTCFLDKIITPFSSIYDLWHPNNILNVDYINKFGLTINSEQKDLYILEIKDFKKLDAKVICELNSKYSNDKKGFFYQAILKDGTYQKQYIFSYSKKLLETISKNVGASILTGEESLKVLKKVVFLDNKKEKLDINTALANAKSTLTSEFEVYQGYKAKHGHIDDVYHKLTNTKIKGIIWGYYDFYQNRVQGYLSNNLNKQDIDIFDKNLVIINFILISKNITKEEINQISNIYNISLVKKSIDYSQIILKTPLKYRDVEWDLLVNLDYLSSQFIAKG